MGDVADESTLSCIQLHLTGEVLKGHGDALEGFATGIPHRLEHDAQRAGRFLDASA